MLPYYFCPFFSSLVSFFFSFFMFIFLSHPSLFFLPSCPHGWGLKLLFASFSSSCISNLSVPFFFPLSPPILSFFSSFFFFSFSCFRKFHHKRLRFLPDEPGSGASTPLSSSFPTSRTGTPTSESFNFNLK